MILNSAGLILQNLRYHWRAFAAAGAASAVGTAVLVGALLVGDSVHFSLRAMAVERLGNTASAMQSGDRYFRHDLAKRIAASPGFSNTFTSAEAVLLAEGVCILDSRNTRANKVQVLGIDPGFWKIGTQGPPQSPGHGEVILNERLASALNARVGEQIRLRFFKPGLLPRDAPLGSNEENAVIIRAAVKSIIPDRGLGRFSLQANQATPFNAFLPLADMQEQLTQPGRANVLLLGMTDSDNRAKSAAEYANEYLKNAWQLDDAQLRIQKVPTGDYLEVDTARVFIDDSAMPALLQAGQGIVTYFVNGLRANGQLTPYSMVCAGGPPIVPANLKEDEIVLNSWIAEDLKAKIGDEVEIDYFTVGLMRKLDTRTAKFKVHSIVPLDGMYADRMLMPEFPGISTVDSTHDWDSSIPIDMKKIRPKDEDYWKKFKGTPKAFIALKKGVELWRNRFGTYTAVRYPFSGEETAAKVQLEQIIRGQIQPAQVGMTFMPVREMALAASDQAVDFGQLFLGFSFFLIAAAVLLMALIFQFGVESRAKEMGLLLALGYPLGQVRLLFWIEGILAASIGSLAGVPGGIIYAKAMLYALSTRWQEAVGTSFLEFHAESQSLWIGCGSSIIVAALAIFLAIRRQSARSARELMAPPGVDYVWGSTQVVAKTNKRWLYAGLLGSVIALGIVGKALLSHGDSEAEYFFSAGGLLLLSALAFLQWTLSIPASGAFGNSEFKLGKTGALAIFGVRGCSRRKGRSLATAALLASGSFLVVAVGANQQDASTEHGKESGTGGFALYAETTIPVLEDLNTVTGRLNAGVPEKSMGHASIYQFRVKGGDEASCLNLNHAQKPKILGVSEAFKKRGGFSFTATLGAEKEGKSPWSLLRTEPGSKGPIPAICDDQSLTWALGLKVGDLMTVNDEHGNKVAIKFVGTVANSILQGSVLISEEDFLHLYPSENGYRAFLIDVPDIESATVAQTLQNALQDEGFQTVPAWIRLAEFNAVANTYLSTFQALGSLGMLLGSLGLGIVVLRNMLERRSEIALLIALGFSRGSIAWLIFSEHGWLLLLGLLAGVMPALVAVFPALQSSNVPVPWSSIIFSLLAILACGLISALLATWAAIHAPLIGALSAE